LIIIGKNLDGKPEFSSGIKVEFVKQGIPELSHLDPLKPIQRKKNLVEIMTTSQSHVSFIHDCIRAQILLDEIPFVTSINILSQA
jgi:hypothetical protein